jgi:UDP:flavonoid glycosyltransferase YjiC (YdhE family)
MRILMMTTPVPTHFIPLVPLAWGLRAAGAEVLVAAQPDSIPVIRSAGLVATSVGEAFGVEAWMRGLLKEDKRPLECFARFAPEQMGFYGRVWMALARERVHDYLAVARDWRPELIIADQVEYAALLVAGVLGIPVLHHRWGIDSISDLALRDARVDLADLAAELDLDGLPMPAEKFDPCPPSLQLPSASPGTLIRCVPFHGFGELPPWHGRPRTRRVVVSLGSYTLLLNGVSHVRRVLHACASVPDVEIVATVGPEYWDALGPMPPQVRLVPRTPLHLFLDGCDAVVHHGGSGTTLAASVAGLPQLALPEMSDQFAAGERLAAVGAGITLDDVASQSDPTLLRDSLALLLDRPDYRGAAAELAREAAAMPAPAQVALELLRNY